MTVGSVPIQEREINSQNMAKTELDIDVITGWRRVFVQGSIIRTTKREAVIPETLQYNAISEFLFCPETNCSYTVENWSPGCTSVHWAADVSKFSALLGVSNCVEEVCISLVSIVWCHSCS